MKTTQYYTVSEMAAMRNMFLAAAFILVLLLLAVAGTLLVGLAVANPMSGPPDIFTEPPTVTVLSTVVNGSNVSINFKASVGKSTTAEHTQINRVYYTTDWNQSATYVYEHHNFEKNFFDTKTISEFSYKLNVTGIPEGNRTVTVYAEEYGYYESGIAFFTTDFSSVNFTIDIVPPKVSVLSVESATYNVVDLPLDFTVSEPVSKMSYVLDGQGNVTVSGNTTLIGLDYGTHNVTVYAWDAVGNVGASETVYFSVAEPFPTTIIVAPIAAAAVIGAGLLVYFKKRKH